ncbi:helix-turn-helix domain-containing protein [Clostridium sp. SHJSY1]|uniref:PucR family transcriptional regulator n=1 Tax=Clostridium sp. SHJSY1 TaxID=2942483 RepID=UPI0028762E01|nr:helix-turn-helix domain-containing protein [Clostridium sp. SHJSY1]MDS0526702.1 helix-turn-helix domain-containing protein [Clostridium sp. SHJSY1]
MKITIDYLIQILKKFSPTIMGKIDTCPILSVEWLTSTNWLSKNTLYIAKDAEMLSNLHSISDIHILVSSENINFPTTNASIIILKPSCNLDEVFYEIRELVINNLKLSNFAANLLRILSDGGGLQNLVDEAYQILRNPIYVFDAGLKLISANWNSPIDDNQTKRIVLDKCLNEEDINTMNFEHIHERIQKSTTPVLVNSEKYDRERIITMINKSGKDIGHIVVISYEYPFKDIDLEIVTILRDAVAQYLEKDSFIRNTKGFNYEYFIADLLDGKITTKRQFNNRMSYIDYVFLDYIYVLVVDINRSSNALNINNICSRLESIIFGSQTVIYDNQIILIITRKSEQLLSNEEISSLSKLCTKNSLYIGLSNHFKNIIDIPEYYQQALKSIELGICKHNEANLFIYKQYYLDHIVNTFIQSESLETYCHPSMRYLLDYDKKNDTELAYTLYMYIVNERNLINTANTIHVHRNTVVYRLKKINSLINLDLDDYNTRQYITLSFAMSSNSKSIVLED